MQAQSVETSTTVVDATEPVALLETNFGNEQPIVTVPYSCLQRSPLNVRTKPPSGIAGLAANVRPKGHCKISWSTRSRGRTGNTANMVSAQVNGVKPRSINCSSRSTSPPTIRYRYGSSVKAKRSPFR